MFRTTPILSRDTADKLVQFKISKKRYRQNTRDLLDIGYTQEQADRLIINAQTSSTVRAVLSATTKLMSQPYCLDREQIIKIALSSGRAHSIHAIIKYFVAMTRLNYTVDQIIAYASQSGGLKTIEQIVIGRHRELNAMVDIVPPDSCPHDRPPEKKMRTDEGSSEVSRLPCVENREGVVLSQENARTLSAHIKMNMFLAPPLEIPDITNEVKRPLPSMKKIENAFVNELCAMLY